MASNLKHAGMVEPWESLQKWMGENLSNYLIRISMIVNMSYFDSANSIFNVLFSEQFFSKYLN